MIDLEKDGSAYFGSPRCRCLSRRQKRVAELTWYCYECKAVNAYRVTADGYIAFDRETALAIDESRRQGVTCRP